MLCSSVSLDRTMACCFFTSSLLHKKIQKDIRTTHRCSHIKLGFIVNIHSSSSVNIVWMGHYNAVLANLDKHCISI